MLTGPWFAFINATGVGVKTQGHSVEMPASRRRNTGIRMEDALRFLQGGQQSNPSFPISKEG
jgi:hypothetical protein